MHNTHVTRSRDGFEGLALDGREEATVTWSLKPNPSPLGTSGNVRTFLESEAQNLQGSALSELCFCVDWGLGLDYTARNDTE